MSVAVAPTVVGPPRPTGHAHTLGGFLREVCAEHGPREALVLDDPLRSGATVRWTYDELWEQSVRVATGLLARGVAPASRVAVLMGNRPEAVAGLFGAALAGAVAVPLSTFATTAELEVLLRMCGARTVLTQTRLGRSELASTLLAARAPLLREVVVLGEDAGRGTPWEALVAEAGHALVEVSAAGVHASDEGLVVFSSGSTAEPKGVLHAHAAPTQQFRVQSALFGRTTDTRMWTALPLFWTAGLNTAVGATLAAGGCTVMQEGFDAGVALALMAREAVTEPYTLPHQARALTEHPSWPDTDLSSLRCVFGKSVFAKHPTVSGDPDWQMPVGWGMSETCAFISAHPSSASREAMRRSLGAVLPGLELAVVDPDDGRPVPAGEQGELWVRGSTLMLRYVGKERAECFTPDGWLRTGDIGSVDADGEVHWEGRRTELIRTGGVNVSPAELEVALRAEPDVRLVRVLGMPDERLGEVVVLCAEPAEGRSPDAASLLAFLRSRVSAYKLPKRVELFAPGTIPLTANGTKVHDAALRDVLRARGHSDHPGGTS